MKSKSLFITLASGAAFAYGAYRLLQKTMACTTAAEGKPRTAKPSDFESRSNPRTPLSELPPDGSRTGSGLQEGSPRPDQTSDWYGDKPKP